MQLVLFCGIQATGKSTFYQQRFFHTHVRISMDLLRTRHRERRLLELCLETQQRCVIDNTNPTQAERAVYLTAARAAGFEVVGYFFQSVAGEALVRNQQRPPERQIPDKGIRATRNRLELPSRAEGFDQLYFVRVLDNQAFDVTSWQDEI
ncbi:AAA family ATPase [Microvirga sp. STR05]|uniref:AAA family ATPase n=1 Tax=Hymenobacter duratus TaxID=2771356 RepID=A0ABR8JMD2_9BACT|nr:AAA family ATPase [Hymenobacter duratus]MBD2716761.1 AAA family ATPase [Hymenobacter duratus]MBR7951676.1 AAA family ATPase [Microvirga sp. STR05]